MLGMIKVFVELMFIMLIIVLLIFIVFGLIVNLILMGIVSISMFLYDNVGFIVILLFVVVYLWLVFIGIYKVFSLISI